KEAGENGIDSKTVQAAVEDYHKSAAGKSRRGKSSRTQNEKERWTRPNYNALLALEQSEVKRLREENDTKNSKSRISTLLAEGSSLDSQILASESRLEAIGREEASAAVLGDTAANAAYLRRLKRVIAITAGGDAAITVFLASDYFGVGSFDML